MYTKPFTATAKKYQDKEINFMKMNFDENVDTIQKLVREGVLSQIVRAIPCTIFLEDGKEVDRFLGPDANRLEEKIKVHYLK